MTFVTSVQSGVAASSAAALQAAFAEFAASTAQLATQDEDLRRSVELLRMDLAQTHGRLHDEMRRRVKSEAQLGSMFASAPFGLVAIDAGRISAFNPAAARLLPGLAEGAVWSLPAQWIRRGAGNEFATDRGQDAQVVALSVLTQTGSGTQLLRLEDITETLRDRERAERQERLAAMGRMTAELAHQLRTPLCTATLYASQLAEPELEDPDRQQMASRLGAQLSQLDALITRMLGFVKTNSRQPELSAIEPLVRGQIESIAPLFAQRGVHLDLLWQAPDCEIAVDRLQIGSAVLALLAQQLKSAGTIVWNGPVGVFEFEAFSHGTEVIAHAIAASDAFSIAGGGDTLAAISKFGVESGVSYICTGGGAFLEMLEGRVLPAIDVLERRALEMVS